MPNQHLCTITLFTTCFLVFNVCFSAVSVFLIDDLLFVCCCLCAEEMFLSFYNSLYPAHAISNRLVFISEKDIQFPFEFITRIPGKYLSDRSIKLQLPPVSAPGRAELGVILLENIWLFDTHLLYSPLYLETL